MHSEELGKLEIPALPRKAEVLAAAAHKMLAAVEAELGANMAEYLYNIDKGKISRGERSNMEIVVDQGEPAIAAIIEFLCEEV